jgi:hypothetical protein
MGIRGLREQGTQQTGYSEIDREKQIFLADILLTESALALTIAFPT